MNKTVRNRAIADPVIKKDDTLQGIAKITIANGGINFKTVGKGESIYLGVKGSDYFLRGITAEGLAVSETKDSLVFKNLHTTFDSLLDAPPLLEGIGKVLSVSDEGELVWTGFNPKAIVAGTGVRVDESVDDITISVDLPKGLPGDPGDKGDKGNAGWSPLFDLSPDDTGMVLSIVGWIGGEGSPPDIEYPLGVITGEGICDAARRLAIIPKDAPDKELFSWIAASQIKSLDPILEQVDNLQAYVEESRLAAEAAKDTILSLFAFPEDFGGKVDGSDCSEALELAAATGKTVVLRAGLYNVTKNCTISADLKIERGAKLRVPDGVNLVLTGEIEAGFYQIFTGWPVDTSQSTTVSHHDQVRIKIEQSQEIHPEWWGARGDLQTNDKGPWQRMLLALPKKAQISCRPYASYQFDIGGLCSEMAWPSYVTARDIQRLTISGNGASIKMTKRAGEGGLVFEASAGTMLDRFHLRDLIFEGAASVHIKKYTDLIVERLTFDSSTNYGLVAQGCGTLSLTTVRGRRAQNRATYIYLSGDDMRVYGSDLDFTDGDGVQIDGDRNTHQFERCFGVFKDN